MHCYCIGRDGYDQLINKGYNCELIDEEENSNFQTFRNGNWSNITYNKFKIIYDNLLTNTYVLYSDGDIVYENNDFLEYLLTKIEDNDMLIQNDTPNNDDNDDSQLCSGFMLIKSIPNTLALFNPSVMKNKKNEIGWDDQKYINRIKHKLKYTKLPLDLFPNGKYYYDNNSEINPYIIHFNWIIGHEKKEKMIFFNKWNLS